MFIYKITNIKNNKPYIGQTIYAPIERWKRHCQDAMSNRLDTHFARAIKKYGKENFRLEVIDTAQTQKELTQKESYWIEYYNSINEGYNETSAMEKSGGFTYKSKTEEELNQIGKKISQTKIGGKNINATKVKCRNIKTKEELYFDSQSEMQQFFNVSNHIFISRRCRGEIKKPYLDLWEIAYETDEYGTQGQNIESTYRQGFVGKVKSITVKDLETNEVQTFPTYASAERYFNQKTRSFSSKASKRPDTFIYKERYQITKNYK